MNISLYTIIVIYLYGIPYKESISLYIALCTFDLFLFLISEIKYCICKSVKLAEEAERSHRYVRWTSNGPGLSETEGLDSSVLFFSFFIIKASFLKTK